MSSANKSMDKERVAFIKLIIEFFKFRQATSKENASKIYLSDLEKSGIMTKNLDRLIMLYPFIKETGDGRYWVEISEANMIIEAIKGRRKKPIIFFILLGLVVIILSFFIAQALLIPLIS